MSNISLSDGRALAEADLLNIVALLEVEIQSAVAEAFSRRKKIDAEAKQLKRSTAKSIAPPAKYRKDSRMTNSEIASTVAAKVCLLRNLPGMQTAGALTHFAAGETNGAIMSDAGNTAADGLSNVAGGALNGASIGSMAGPMGAGVGAAVGALAASSKEIAQLPSRIVKWSESLVESQRSLSRFSAPLSQAMAQSDVRGMKRDFKSAQITGGSTADLSKNLEDLYDAIRPMKDIMTVQLSAGLSGLVALVKDMVPVMKALLDVGLKMVPGGDQLRQATEDRIRGQEHIQRILRKSQGQTLTAAFRKLQAEDPMKPRQAPRR